MSRSLAELEAMYGSLVEMLPAVVYVAEPQPPYATIFVSPAITSLGYSLEQWMAHPDSWVRALYPEDREWVLAQTAEAVASQRDNDFEYRLVAGDDSIRWIHDRGRFVWDGERPICWQGVMLDITEKKRLETERRVLADQLDRATSEIDTLSGLLPICSYCHRVRDDRDYWQAIETYFAKRSRTRFSHGICPECYETRVKPELDQSGE